MSCKKDKIKISASDFSENEVLFYFYGKINQTDIQIEAGKNNYYLFTSKKYDNQIQTHLFEGTFGKLNCPECPNSLKVIILDDTLKPSNSVSNIQNIFPGNFNYYYHNDSTIIKSNVHGYHTDSLLPTNSYTFYINGNPVSFQSSFTHTLTHHNSYNNTFSVTLKKFNSDENCTSLLTNTYSVNSSFFYCTLKTKFNNNWMTYEIASNKNSPVNYTLYLGNSQFTVFPNVTNSLSVSYLYPSYIFTTDIYPSVIAQDQQGNISSYTTHIKPFANPPSNCVANFIYDITPVYAKIIKNKIIIKWKDENGDEFSSLLEPQPSNSYFKIHEISEYVKNENGLPTKKIKASLFVRLYKTTDSSIWKDIQGQLSFAVAY
jgi:L-rhamnose mutarotase